jgi:hypothetical protein
MNNQLQKSAAPFRPFFGIFKENSAANFSGRTNFCRAPFEFCGRNFGPLATLLKTINEGFRGISFFQAHFVTKEIYIFEIYILYNSAFLDTHKPYIVKKKKIRTL